MSFCVLCQKRYRFHFEPGFCPSCEEEWLELEQIPLPLLPLPRQTIPAILSHCVYRGICRRSILAFKSQGFRRLGPALAKRMLSRAEVVEWARQSHVIMPAPSSLWSRWHGKLDLAASLAEQLAIRSGRLVRSPPFSLGFRWGKQALRSRSKRGGVFRRVSRRYDERYFADFVAGPWRQERLRVLLVDDVVTTGNTLADMAGLFENVDFKFYTLASAFRFSENTGRTWSGFPDSEG